MKRIIKVVLGAAPLFLVLNAAAESCPTLEYQELKDMHKKELIQEYCGAAKASVENIQAALDAIQAGGNHKKPTEEAGQCQEQVKRIARVLEKKGVKTKQYDVFCKGVS